MNLINQSSLALNWVDPPAPQEQPSHYPHSCKSKFCDCLLLGTPDLDSLMLEASSVIQQDSSLLTVDLSMQLQAPLHSGNTATLHGSGPTCDLPVDNSEVAGGSKVDLLRLLSASGGTLSTVLENKQLSL